MNLTGAIPNSALGDGIYNALEQAIPQLAPLISILKALGIVFIGYLIFLIVNGIIRWKDSRRLKRVEEKVDSIQKKLKIKYI